MICALDCPPLRPQVGSSRRPTPLGPAMTHPKSVDEVVAQLHCQLLVGGALLNQVAVHELNDPLVVWVLLG